VRKHFDDDEIGTLVTLVSFINAANRMNVIVRNPGGAYDRSAFADLEAS
jgi:hypothetical protein